VGGPPCRSSWASRRRALRMRRVNGLMAAVPRLG
jgi:hypothetical protein